MSTKNPDKSFLYRFLPFLLTAAIVAADQLTKAWVVKNIPLGTIYREIGGDLLWIVHVRNKGAAFSLGAGTGTVFRKVVFTVFPIIIMVLLGYGVCSKRVIRRGVFTDAQRWFCAGIMGGGIGTIIDRIFRFDQGVVDFISVKFFGIFGMERWPTFNVSDSCVVIFVLLFALSVFFGGRNREPGKQGREGSR